MTRSRRATTPGGSPRVYALSDLHVDFKPNLRWLEALHGEDYSRSVLVVAGDISDDLEKLGRAFELLRATFGEVFFVPGNHELWVRRGECRDSLGKFDAVLELARSQGVRVDPAVVGECEARLWIVPLFSWYVKHDEGNGSLYLPKEGEDKTLIMWADTHYARWPTLGPGETIAHHFLAMNEVHLERSYDAPILSFSHFLPRRELMFATAPGVARTRPIHDPHPTFNFSSVAGVLGLDEQIRRLGATVHVYGHQHRNRHRHIDGVLYVSHCLGSPREHRAGMVGGERRPRRVWPMTATDE